jgi:hypothetical protein
MSVIGMAQIANSSSIADGFPLGFEFWMSGFSSMDCFGLCFPCSCLHL